jgi:VanZ family protein
MKIDSKKNIAIRTLPMALTMIIIFIFSCMQGDDSSDTSGAILNALVKLMEGVSHKDFSANFLGSMHLIIRKLAHVTEYTALGGCAGFFTKTIAPGLKSRSIFALMISVLYAATDEIHQYFVPGRVGTWSDVLIDSIGIIIGIVIYRALSKKRAKHSLH